MGKGMKAGKKPKNRNGGGAKDMQKQLKQLQAMQAEMEQKQAELEKKELTTTAGGGAVEVTINGKKEITKLVLDKDVVDPDDVEMLQDLVMAAVNEAIRQIEDLEENEMNSITGSLAVWAADSEALASDEAVSAFTQQVDKRAEQASGHRRKDRAEARISRAQSD